MKIKLTLAALLVCAITVCHAQSPFQTGFDSLVKDGAIGGGYWRAITGNYTLYSYDYLYSITSETNTLGAGLIAGGDIMRGNGKTIQNDVKGGFTINYKFNLSPIGFTNVVFKVYAGTAIATPRGNAVGVGNITFVGINYTFRIYKTLALNIDPAYQTRTGQSEFNRNYIGIQAFLSIGGTSDSMLAANDLYLKYAYANLARNDY